MTTNERLGHRKAPTIDSRGSLMLLKLPRPTWHPRRPHRPTVGVAVAVGVGEPLPKPSIPRCRPNVRTIRVNLRMSPWRPRKPSPILPRRRIGRARRSRMMLRLPFSARRHPRRPMAKMGRRKNGDGDDGDAKNKRAIPPWRSLPKVRPPLPKRARAPSARCRCLIPPVVARRWRHRSGSSGQSRWPPNRISRPGRARTRWRRWRRKKR